ncbi:lipid-A-disaccharide synthase-related protein [Vacuolonema iberomarrocanum]|uniref:lipid-A-disaccharide synthase-related protein n=1 Tax=Vacuolonema iberomarrocanum TaxID=3454632 RepID=UPI0019E4D193|nr:hypothetical protein [filamentous cyanobacterium LEGE 07170]
MRLLCLSNGHGEDAIACRILQSLQQSTAIKELAALPLVGTGQAYQAANIPIIGRTQAMPSGGFVYMDGSQLARDVRGGLVQLTLSQLRSVRQWNRSGGRILAVGDVVPLLFAWWSGAPYGFVGTAKSEYYLRDEHGVLTRCTWFERLEGWAGSVYSPLERWLMHHPRCHGVFPRDRLTASFLRKWDIPVFDLGNPMMDGFAMDIPEPDWQQVPLTVALLPGSRAPEVYENWILILEAVQALVETWNTPLEFVGAIAPSLAIEPLIAALQPHTWQSSSDPSGKTVWRQGNNILRLTQTEFISTLERTHWAIALAGTATEQAVGLGKPVIAIPGKGPQFTPAFAEAQTRLLGPSVLLCHRPEAVVDIVRSLQQQPEWRQQIAENGRRRMGTPGAAERISRCLVEQLSDPSGYT